MPNKFSDLLRSSARYLSSKAAEAIDWFKDSVSDINKQKERASDPNKIFKKVAAPQVGSMYLFLYDPKYKATLPFYDMYPLVFPIEMYADGFLGINLHYLPPNQRITLMRALDEIKTNNKYNETTKLSISYELLKRYSSQFRGHEACIKRYLFAHVRSQFNYVNPSEWEKAALLPLQRWSVNSNKKYSGTPPY